MLFFLHLGFQVIQVLGLFHLIITAVLSLRSHHLSHGSLLFLWVLLMHVLVLLIILLHLLLYVT